MKRGFSMIELIFVIVILGILASVALPKLAATRDDATAAGIKSDVGTITQAVPALYMSQKVASITQAVPSLSTTSWTIGNEYYIDSKMMAKTAGSTVPCLRVRILDANSSNTGPLSSDFTNAPTVAANLWSDGTAPWLIFEIKEDSGRTGPCEILYNMGIRDQNITMQGLSIVW